MVLQPDKFRRDGHKGDLLMGRTVKILKWVAKGTNRISSDLFTIGSSYKNMLCVSINL